MPAIAPLLLLDASITFSNWWPTPAVKWSGAPSVELAVLLLVLRRGRSGRHRHASSRRLLRWLSAGWLLLMLGRYVDVTAPALWGRELNFYWDLRFLPDVAAMLVGASRHAVLLGTMPWLRSWCLLISRVCISPCGGRSGKCCGALAERRSDA